jgi:hypothetical protein
MFITALLLTGILAQGYVECLPAGEVVDTELQSISLTELTSPELGQNIGEDRITATVEPLPAGSEHIEILLVSANRVTWMKEVQVILGTEGNSCFLAGAPGSLVTKIFTRDDTHSATTTLRNGLAESCSLRFSKAKAFGAQTDMYELSGSLASLKGQRLTIRWETD